MGACVNVLALRPINILGICAGVGGLELGIRIAEPGAVGVCYLEREAPAAATLVARMEEGHLHPAPIWSDVGTFNPRPWRGVVHCVASGDPCQPNSVAGKRKGKDDDRWLIEHVLRIVDGVRPYRFFRENVVGNAAGQLEAVIPRLEAMGYVVAAGIFAAREVGASHIRERLFIMADRIGDECPWQCVHAGPWGEGPGTVVVGRQGAGVGLSQGDGRREGLADADNHDDRREHVARGVRGSAGEIEGEARFAHGERRRTRSGDGGETMADAGSARLQGRELGTPCEGDRHGPEAHGSVGQCGGTWLPLFAPGPADPRWPDILAATPGLEPSVLRMAYGLAGALDGRIDRIRAVGNGVSSLAAAYAWRTLEARIAQAKRDLAVRRRA